MDDDLQRAVRIEAAKAGKSMSKYLAEAARAKIDADEKASARADAISSSKRLNAFSPGRR